MARIDGKPTETTVRPTRTASSFSVWMRYIHWLNYLGYRGLAIPQCSRQRCRLAVDPKGRLAVEAAL